MPGPLPDRAAVRTAGRATGDISSALPPPAWPDAVGSGSRRRSRGVSRDRPTQPAGVVRRCRITTGAALAGKAKSYAERLFDYPEVGTLDPDAAHAALTIPVRKEGVSFDDGAVDALLEATQNYPYSVQEWGFQVWGSRPVESDRTTSSANATPDVIAHLDASFFRVRFDRLTALQQKYLRAIGRTRTEAHQTGQIATTLGVGAASVATVRQQLVK